MSLKILSWGSDDTATVVVTCPTCKYKKVQRIFKIGKHKLICTKCGEEFVEELKK